ncbi:MAG: branched-chain amino acid transporter AzlD [Ruminococcaceae bacterium]|nr:branched-chain amino acid transporter AzlD [Oscillospiraceae bacterium]
MHLTPLQTLGIIVAVALGTMVTRFLPFLLFPAGRKRPRIIGDLSRLLPPAAMGLLVVYALRGVDFSAAGHWLPSLLAVAATAAIHLWRRSVLLSVTAGTILYMVLIQVVFI